MATIPTDNVVQRLSNPVPMPILTDGTSDINQGDQVYLDTSNHVVKSLGASDDTNAATYVGVALDGSYIQPYSVKEYSPQIPVLTKGICRFKTTSGDTYHTGDAVYVGADCQTVTNTVGGLTKKIGYVNLPPSVSSLAGGAGITVEIWIEAQWPLAAV